MIFKVQDRFFQNIPNAVFGIIVVKILITLKTMTL